jgi:metal-sulfur cluster biosynthetic enzyme
MSKSRLESPIWKKLESVLDPEIHISVVDLGLIYDVQEKNGAVKIKMTLTSLGCPLFETIENEIKEKLLEIRGVKKVEVELVFSPPWSKEKMSPIARARLGI